MLAVLSNRVKFALAGDVLELANPHIPGHPHQRLVEAVLSAGTVHRVLELCAGTGYASRLLAQASPETEVVGVDLSAEMIAVGERKLRASGVTNVSLQVGDISQLPFPDGSFDAVMAVFALHEVPTQVRRVALAESARVLRPSGVFATVDLDRPPAPVGPVTDAYFATMEPAHAKGVCGQGLSRMLEESGFSIDIHTRANGFGMTQTLIATI